MSKPTKPLASRRAIRVVLDADWFVESDGCSTAGRGLEISRSGARLPVVCSGRLVGSVTLFIALPQREEVFQARCRAQHHPVRGWSLTFTGASREDLELLDRSLAREIDAEPPPSRDVGWPASEPAGP
jgi:hypothetical protein